VGKCQQTGTCEAMQDLCSDLFQPVCGCDGRNYSNSYQASVSGVSVDHTGNCSYTSRSCHNSTDCGLGEYCSKEVGKCRQNQTGTCVAKPQLCYLLIFYVCGCDGKTYDNSCVASRNGINVAHSGQC
jgi:hypothetical protein